MIKTNEHKTKWKDHFICLSVNIVFVSLCGFAAYIPVIPSVPQDLFLEFILGRLKLIVLAAVIFSGLGFYSTIISIVFSYRFKPVIVKSFWKFIPYTFTVFFMVEVLYLNTLSIEDNKLWDANYVPNISPDLMLLNSQWDLPWFLCAVLNGYLFFFSYKGYMKSFVNVVSNGLTNQFIYPIPPSFEDKDLLEEAERLANTFSSSNREEAANDDSPVPEFEFYAFIYGEGFDYGIIDEGYVVRFLFGDADRIDDLYDGIYFRINETLYIRFDHIMLVDMKELYIVISPVLEALFEKINNKSVKEKLYSYRYPDKGRGYYQINLALETKLRDKFKMKWNSIR